MEGQLGQALQPLESVATPAAVDALANFKVHHADNVCAHKL